MYDYPDWYHYLITEDSYKSLVMSGRDWVENPHAHGTHTAYALDGIDPKPGDFLLVECVTRFGKVNRPVVIFCSSQIDVVSHLFHHYQSDALKLARYFGCKDVRSFEIWQIMPEAFEKYVLVEGIEIPSTGETLITGELVFDTESEINDYIKSNNLYIENYDSHWSDRYDSELDIYYSTYDYLYYYICTNRYDSICYESPYWAYYDSCC